ncbi:hypothetical protein B0H13DRAFT_2123215 [Mycena leptocephala]|nr:hypothetical protein B0H13DRAFT_2123215 [Mycena leptocephala]
MAVPPHRARSPLGFLKDTYSKLRDLSRSQPALGNTGSASHPAPPISGPPATSRPFLSTADNYLAIGTLPCPAPLGPLTRGQRVNQGTDTIFEGLKTVVQGLFDCSDMFLPLKAATGVFLWICNTVDTVSGNKKELQDLEAKLTAILSIVKKISRSRRDIGTESQDHNILRGHGSSTEGGQGLGETFTGDPHRRGYQGC